MNKSGGRARWMILVAIILAVLAVVWVAWGGAVRRWVAERADPDSTHLAQAVAAYRAGDWARAADLTRPMLKAGTDNADVLRVYARACARLNRDTAAASVYAGRLGISRMEPEDLYLLGLLNARAGRLESAFDFWLEAERKGNDDAELLEGIARLAPQLRRLDEGAEAARRLSQKPPVEVRGLLLLGDILALLDDPKGSVDALRSALERDPAGEGSLLPTSHYRKQLARGLLQLGKPADAIEAIAPLHKSAGGEGADAQAEWLLSRAWLQKGDRKEAEAAAARAGSYRAEHILEPEPSPYAGEASCVACHREVALGHERSRHARTFHHGKGLLELPVPTGPMTDQDDPQVTHAVHRDNDKIKVETHAGDKIYRLIVEYAFGPSDQYVTMIGRDDEQTYRALRFSSYHTADGVGWGPTAGDVPNSGKNIRGEPIQVRDGAVRCLYCHVTSYREFRNPPPQKAGPAAADRGIGCERCHGPGGNHVKAMKGGGFVETAIVNPAAGGAEAVVKMCADCHVVSSEVEIKKAPDDPRFARSPALTLTFSRCFTSSDGAMSCMTCHDAHRDDQGSASHFEGKCLSCHSAKGAAEKPSPAPAREAGRVAGKRPVVCPVNPSAKCLDCHMVKVPMPLLHRDLTDHYIRVHDANKKK